MYHCTYRRLTYCSGRANQRKVFFFRQILLMSHVGFGDARPSTTSMATFGIGDRPGPGERYDPVRTWYFVLVESTHQQLSNEHACTRRRIGQGRKAFTARWSSEPMIARHSLASVHLAAWSSGQGGLPYPQFPPQKDSALALALTLLRSAAGGRNVAVSTSGHRVSRHWSFPG